MEIKKIKLDEIKESRFNVREEYDLKAMDISEGYTHRPIVIPIEEAKYEVLVGHRRVEKARDEGLTEIECEIKKSLSDKEILKEIGWKINDYLERKPKLVFSISFYVVYFIICLIKLGILWVGLSLLFSLFVLGIVAAGGGLKRYSVIGDYYWTEPEVTTDFGVLLFLLVFLICTDLPLVASTNLDFGETWFVTIIIFIIGLISAMVLATETKTT